jgi:thiol-disulfide isomerase/thioredoxin
MLSVAAPAGLLMRSDEVFAQPAGAPSAGTPGYTLTPWSAATTPPLTLTDLRGQPWSLAAQRGRVVLLNFWATWCEPCRAEMPALQALADRLGAGRLAVVGVNYQETEARIERFVSATGIRFPVLLDRDGSVTRAWTRRIFPTSVLVGPDGRARQVIVGEFDWSGPQAAALVAALLPR